MDFSNSLLRLVTDRSIFDTAASANSDLPAILKNESRGAWSTRHLQPKEIGVVHVLEPHCGTSIRLAGDNLDAAQFDVSGVAYKKSVRRHRAQLPDLWISGLLLLRPQSGHLRRAAALMLKVNVADLDVFDLVAGNSTENGGVFRNAVGTDNVADENAAQRSGGDTFGPFEATAQTQKQRRVGHIPHRDSGDCYVFEGAAVHAFQREPAAGIENTI